MPRRAHHVQTTRPPALRKLMGRSGRADHVIAALHDDPWDMGDLRQIAQQLPIFLEEAPIDEVMVFQSGKGPGVVCRGLAGVAVALHRGQSVFPGRPGPRIAGFDHEIAGKEPPVIGRDHVAAFRLGHQRGKPRPLVRPELSRPAAIEPVQLALSRQEDAAQRQEGRRLGMCFGIGKRQGRAPASPENGPSVDAKCRSDQFDIADEMPGGIRRRRGVGPRPATTALIEEDHPKRFGVEIAPHRRAASTAGAAMQDDNRRALGIAALFDIDLMAIAHIQHPLIEGINRRVEIGACALLAGELVHTSPI